VVQVDTVSPRGQRRRPQDAPGVDLAVGIAIGAAFGFLVGAFISPLLGAILGGHELGTRYFTLFDVVFPYGLFVDTLLTFVLTAAAIFFVVVKPITALRDRQRRGEVEDPTERPCPECLSQIPVEARRCAFCTS
jgi:large conductance mechanosensitive channel